MDPRSSGPTDNAYKTAYTYDDNDRLTRIDYPDGTYETTTYDEVGNVTGKTDQKGQSTTYQYDNANRLTKITYHDSATTEFTYDAAGRTLSRKDPDGSAVYFQSLGSMAREFRLDSGGDLVYDYYTVYDDDGRVDKFLDCTEATIAKYNLVKYNENVNKIGYLATTILGQNFKYGENKKYREGTTDSRIKWGKIKLGSGGIQYAASSGVQITGYNYDDDGSLLSFTDPFGKTYRFENSWRKSRTYYPNNTYAEREFDEYGRLSSITHKRTETDGSETTLESFSYQYDDSGNITKITYANGEYTDYTYDSLDRLTIEEKKTSGGASIYKIEYKFDNNDAKNGNIHQVIVNDADTTTFTYNEMNQLTNITHPDSSTETLTYDDNGNLTQTSHNGEITSYQWDCSDRLTKVTNPNGEITEFTYDSDGMLVKEKSSGTERKFIQNNRYATRELTKNDRGEWEPTARHIIHGTMLSTYISPTSSNHPKSKNKNQNNRTDTIFYHTDHLGSVRLVTDRNGNIIDSISTDAYGNPLPHANSSGGKNAKMLQEFNFVGTHGIRYVEKIKLHNMRARWYNISLRRFVLDDFLRYDDGSNVFIYSNNNPVNYYDLSGLKASKAKSDVGKTITAVEALINIYSLNVEYTRYDATEWNNPQRVKVIQSIYSDAYFACMIFAESSFTFHPRKEVEITLINGTKTKIHIWGLLQLAEEGAIGQFSKLNKTNKDAGRQLVFQGWTEWRAKNKIKYNVGTGIWYLYYTGSITGFGTGKKDKVNKCSELLKKELKCANINGKKVNLMKNATKVNVGKLKKLSDKVKRKLHNRWVNKCFSVINRK